MSDHSLLGSAGVSQRMRATDGDRRYLVVLEDFLSFSGTYYH
jgi:hypothetical protein